MVNYTTLESVKDSYMGDWKDKWDEKVEKAIPQSAVILRGIFSHYNMDLDAQIALGKPSAEIVELVSNNMIIRKVTSSDGSIAATGVDWQNVSMNAGPYGFSGQTNGSIGSFYLKSDEKELLRLPKVSFGSVNFQVFRTPPQEVFPIVP